MSGNRSLMDVVLKPVVRIRRLLPWRKWPVRAGCYLGAAVLLAALLILISGAILNGYAKPRIERAFAAAYPGSTLRIGRLSYAAGANRLVARSVTLSSPSSILTAGRISLTGIGWLRLLRGTAALVNVLARARCDAADLAMEFPGAHYRLCCARLRASVPDSALTADATELAPVVGDEVIFAASPYRTTRFRLFVPDCRVSGLSFGDLLQGTSFRARSIEISQPSFDALSNRDKPAPPFDTSPQMVNEALAAISRPLRVDSLVIANGHLTYGERVVARAAPGVLTFTAVNLIATGFTNRGDSSAAIMLAARGNLMDAGELSVLMTIPLATPGFALHYSGTLGAMDLTRLNAFLEIVELIRIKSGSAAGAAFKIDLSAGHARGTVRATYQDFKLAMLDAKTGSEKGLGNRIATFVANAFQLRAANTPASRKVGTVDYWRRRGDTFLQVMWFSLRSGVLDAIKQ